MAKSMNWANWVMVIGFWVLVIGLDLLLPYPALARHHKKKQPTPKPTPHASIRNPVDAPDHAGLRPEDLWWLNQ